MPDASNPYRKVVIDTSPLLDALVLQLIDREPKWELQILGRSRLSRYLEADRLTRKHFRELLDSIETLLITSHVIGEIRSDWHVHPDLHATYWQGCMDFFGERNVDERLVTLADLSNDEALKQVVTHIGPTDVGLMALANHEECPLLTNDGRLYSWLSVFNKLNITMVESLVGF
jgi:hypothetical protein